MQRVARGMMNRDQMAFALRMAQIWLEESSHMGGSEKGAETEALDHNEIEFLTKGGSISVPAFSIAPPGPDDQQHNALADPNLKNNYRIYFSEPLGLPSSTCQSFRCRLTVCVLAVCCAGRQGCARDGRADFVGAVSNGQDSAHHARPARPAGPALHAALLRAAHQAHVSRACVGRSCSFAAVSP